MKQEDAWDVFIEVMVTGDPSAAIRNREARGQDALVRSEVLPKRIQGGNREQFEEMGIEFGEDVDDLFVRVTLPDGWKKVRTDHQMWSKLVDDKGRERASIFYKAAFYDRSAHMNIVRRYSYSVQPLDGDYDSFDMENDPMEAVVLDGNEVIWRSEPMYPSEEVASYELNDHLGPLALAWLEKNYPDWQDPLAYWD